MSASARRAFRPWAITSARSAPTRSQYPSVTGRTGSCLKSVVVGAGTVLDEATAQRCLEAGAEFLVSPGLDLPTIKLALREEKVVMAGALTPTEIITAWKAGSDFVKIFPCGEVGGARYIKALRGPLPQVRMVPTGGVDLTTAAEFIRAGAAALGVGGELVQAEALRTGRPGIITANARRFVAAVKEARAQMGLPQEAALAISR